jgi:hypothetical protein
MTKYKIEIEIETELDEGAIHQSLNRSYISALVSHQKFIGMKEYDLIKPSLELTENLAKQIVDNAIIKKC